MAFSESELAELKAKIPAKFQPSPDAAGQLPQAFQIGNTGVLRTPGNGLQAIENSNDPLTNDKAREWASLVVAMTPGSTAAFMLTGAQAAIQHAAQEKTEEKKRDEDRRFVDQVLAELNRRLGEIANELANIDKRLNEITKRRTEIGDSLEAIDDLSELIASGKLDENNPAHAALMRRAGVTPEDMRRKDAAETLRQRRAALHGEDTTLQTEENDKIRRRGELKTEEAGIKAAKSEIENADTDEARRDAADRARTLQGQRQLTAAAYDTESVSGKIIASEAVAVRSESKVNNVVATTETDEYLSGGDDMAWGNAPNKSSSPTPS